MRIYTILIGVLFLTLTLNGQTVKSKGLLNAEAKIEKCKKIFFQGEFDQILQLTQEVFDFAIIDSMIYDSLIADVYYAEGRVFMERGNYTRAETLVKKSLDTRKRVFGKYSAPVVKSLDVLATISYYNYDYKKAESYYFECWEALDSIGDKKNKSWVSLFINLGGYFYSQSDYQKSTLYYEKSITSIKDIYGDEHVDLIIAYVNLGAANESNVEYMAAIENYQKGIEVYNKMGEAVSPYYLAHIQLSMGLTYLESQNPSLAIEYLEASLSTLATLKENNYRLKHYIHRIIGDCLMSLPKRKENAISHYHKSIELNQFLPDLQLDEYFAANYGIANVYKAEKKYGEALAIFQNLFDQVAYVETDYSYEKVTVPTKVLAEGLDAKLGLLLEKYHAESKVEDLYAAKVTAKAAIDVIDTMKLNVRESASRQNLVNIFYSTYEKAIEVSYLLYGIDQNQAHVNTAFTYSEKSKSNQLMEAVLQTKAEKFAGIPETLLAKEQQLKIAITKKKKAKHKFEAGGEQIESDELALVSQELFDLKVQYEQLIQTFEEKYPKYHSLKYATQNAGLKHVQENRLKDDNTILEYFVGDEGAYVFVINKDVVRFQKLDEQLDFKEEIKSYYNSMRNYRIKSEQRDSLNAAYVVSAHTLYKFLVEPIEPYLHENVIVIPDGMLNYLPFAALLKTYPENAWEFKTHDYLLDHYNFSYNYSTTLMDEMEATHRSAAANNLLAIAPSFLSPYQGIALRSESLLPLEHNENEIATILKFCKGKSLIKSEANKSNFFKNASDYKAIHFATHGVANEKSGAYSYIAFTSDEQTKADENILFGVDIYNLDLKAEMVVLSACETAAGELKRGEGVMSTARAFSFAGARNLITSLWKVSDSKATDLMASFYQELQQDKKKDLALREAKQDYIASNQHHMAHPFFWASFISIGSQEALDLESPFPLMTAVGGGLVLVIGLLGWQYWKRKKEREQMEAELRRIQMETEVIEELVDGD